VLHCEKGFHVGAIQVFYLQIGKTIEYPFLDVISYASKGCNLFVIASNLISCCLYKSALSLV